MTVGVSSIRPKSDAWYRTTHTAKRVLAHLIVIVAILISLYPVWTMALNALKTDDEVSRNPAGFPINWTLASYMAIFEYHDGLWVNFVNSVVIAVTSTALAVFLASMAAFAFAKYDFWGRDLAFALLLGTMMVPSEITVPPLYIAFSRLGWLNTYRVQIVPTVASVFGLFMIRQYLRTTPDALLEAARIDGASHWQLFARIIVPISAPVMGAFAILHFMSVWNSYLWPLVVTTEQRIQPVMVVLPNLRDPQIGYLPVWGTIMAGCMLATLPIVIVFVIFQDTFMSSVVVGAVKE